MKHLKTYIEFILENKMTKEEFIRLSKEKWNKLYDYSHVVYVNMTTPVRIECKKHGPFNVKPIDYLKGVGCPNCSSAKGFDKLINQQGYDPLVIGSEEEKTFYNKKNKPSKYKNISGRNISR